MKRIQLTKGQNAIVDDEDFILFGHVKWTARFTNDSFYAYRGVPSTGGRRRFVYLHREIMGVTDRNHEVDHIDGNPLNNQKTNLRVCTRKQNSRNRFGANKNSKSGIRGVSYHHASDTWRAQICVNGNNKLLGSFKTAKLAEESYIAANKKYFKEFGGNL